MLLTNRSKRKFHKALRLFCEKLGEMMSIIYEPICYKENHKINGYEATILVDICDAFLEARKNINLSPRQTIIAEQCGILMRSFAKVGIIALVDEATGYQYERERFELQKTLTAYISDEIAKWQLTFTKDFYEQIYRLWKIPTSPNKNRHQFIGKITNEYVYKQLPNGILEALKSKTPKSEEGNYTVRFHQSLTPEVGRENLKKQITKVTTLMEISDSKEEFERMFQKNYGKEPFQFSFADYERLHTALGFNTPARKNLTYGACRFNIPRATI